MQNRLILTSVWQLSTGREISLWRSTLRSEGPEPHTEDPQARVLVLGRGAPTKFGVKISRDSDHLGEMEDCWKLRHPLKGRMHRITRRHSLTLGSGRGIADLEAPKTYKERLNHVASGRGLERQPPLSLC